MSISRRTVMKKFGDYIYWLTWFNEIKCGSAEPPEGEDISYVIRAALAKEEEYLNAISQLMAQTCGGCNGERGSGSHVGFMKFKSRKAVNDAKFR